MDKEGGICGILVYSDIGEPFVMFAVVRIISTLIAVAVGAPVKYINGGNHLIGRLTGGIKSLWIRVAKSRGAAAIV